MSGTQLRYSELNVTNLRDHYDNSISSKRQTSAYFCRNSWLLHSLFELLILQHPCSSTEDEMSKLNLNYEAQLASRRFNSEVQSKDTRDLHGGGEG
jgi:hypothetical protein